jgi:transcriptional regulator with XRE-family HTH domain
MYMAKGKPLRWRHNCIRFWREFRGMTQEQAAAALARPPFNLDYGYNSVGRVENGKQMPTIELIEALATLYDTDIDSLLNRRPETARESPPATAKGLLQLWDQAQTEERGLIVDVAKRVVRGRS